MTSLYRNGPQSVDVLYFNSLVLGGWRSNLKFEISKFILAVDNASVAAGIVIS